MKKTFLLIMVVLIVFNISACNRSVIKQDDPISFDEAMSKLEAYISEEYSLENFDIKRIYLSALYGSGLCSARSIPYGITIEGTYGDNEKWRNHFDILTKDDSDILVQNSTMDIIYNKESDEDFYKSFYGVDTIVTDTPGWVIEGIYKTIIEVQK